jgi:hypothetical protein
MATVLVKHNNSGIEFSTVKSVHIMPHISSVTIAIPENFDVLMKYVKSGLIHSFIVDSESVCVFVPTHKIANIQH